MRILLTGAAGQVGVEFLRAASHLAQITATSRAECDLADPKAIRRVVQSVRPEVIVNAAAYTAVDKAETDCESCYAANAVAPGLLAEEAQGLGALLIHYSTDYVFNGSKTSPYSEQDEPCPLGEYGRSKLEGEKRIVASGARALILRTSWVYGSHGKNFLLTMLRLANQRPELRIVADQIGSPTAAQDIAMATTRIITEHSDRNRDFPFGVYHMTAGGQTSWFGFARAIFERAALGASPVLTPIESAEYPTPAQRPMNSVLSNDKFAATFGFRLRPWEEALKDVMLDIKHAGPVTRS